MRKRLLAAAVVAVSLAPARADIWAKPDYQPTQSTYRALIVIADVTEKRSEAMKDDGRALATALIESAADGKPVVIYIDGLDGRLELRTPREGVIKPTPCPKRTHPLGAIGKKPCDPKGYEAAKAAFRKTVEDAFAPYFDDAPPAPQSAPFNMIARVVADNALAAGNAGADIVYLTDGIPYTDHFLRFSLSRDWLPAPDALREQMALRGLLPELRRYRLIVIGAGRSFQGDVLPAEKAQQIIALWQFYAQHTGAALTMSPTLGPAQITLIRTLDEMRKDTDHE